MSAAPEREQKQPRYRLVCVAPGVPDMAGTDDLDEAIVAVGDYYGSHFDILDTQTSEWVQSPTCLEEVVAAVERLAARKRTTEGTER